MVEIAIFTEEVVRGLIDRGYAPVGKTSKAWYFEDSDMLRIALEEILEQIDSRHL